MAGNQHLVSDDAGKPNKAEQRLLDSAMALFSEKGYAATSIREIIERAGVTRPVLYYYFKNKEDLFRHIVESSFDEFVGDLRVTLDRSAGCTARLAAVACEAFRQCGEYPDVVRLILQMFMAPPGHVPQLDKTRLWESWFSRIRDIMTEGLKAGELRGGDAHELAIAFTGMVTLHIMLHVNRPEARLRPEQGEALVDLFLAGGGVPKAERCEASLAEPVPTTGC
jgi:AcrR family transcriptional regulator